MALLSSCAETKKVATNENGVPYHTEEFYVNDFAGILSDETEKYIFDTSRAYANSNGTQVVVLTMPTLNGEDIERFSIKTAREWGIGDKEEDNGVLITVDMDDRNIRVEVGYGLEGVLNDGKCGQFIREVTEQLSDGDYDGGIKRLYSLVINELENPTEYIEEEYNKSKSYSGVEVLVYLILLFVIVGIFIIFDIRGGISGSGLSSGGFGSDSYGGSSDGGFGGDGGDFGGGGASGSF